VIGDREREAVELVSPEGMTIGSCPVADAHAAPGLLHRAFSVLLFDGAGRTLLQRRAATKTRFPRRWANACCGHPSPGEAVVAAASRRLREELGVRGVELTEVGVHRYRADDPATGGVEWEYDHVLVARVAADLAVAYDPAEVEAVRWAVARELRTELAASGSGADSDHSPWLLGVLSVALDTLTTDKSQN
jgi:isopentenyl-diphosphate delta-isomerase